jgi:hypothetical protein
MVAVEKQATRSGSRCVGQERSLATWPPENIAPPNATVTLFGVRQGKCMLHCPGTSRSQQRQCNHGCGLTCPARYAGDALHRLETVLAADQQGDIQDAAGIPALVPVRRQILLQTKASQLALEAD